MNKNRSSDNPSKSLTTEQKIPFVLKLRLYYGGFSLSFTKHGFLIRPVMLCLLSHPKHRCGAASLWVFPLGWSGEGISCPSLPVFAEQQERTRWEPLSLSPCTKPAGAKLFGTRHPGYLASNKCLKCRTQNLNLWTISHCSWVLGVSPEHLEKESRKDKSLKKQRDQCS